MNITGLIVVSVVLVVAAAFGLYRRATDGRIRQLMSPAAGELPGVHDDVDAVIVQFSSEFCAPCRRVRSLIGQTIGAREDVQYLDLDVAEHPDLAEHYDVLRTPTVLILDRTGTSRFRASGALRPRELTAAIATLAPLKESA